KHSCHMNTAFRGGQCPGASMAPLQGAGRWGRLSGGVAPSCIDDWPFRPIGEVGALYGLIQDDLKGLLSCGFFRHLRHQAEHIVLRILKGDYPQIVGRHLRHERRLIHESNSAREKCLMGFLDVYDIEIKNRTGMVQLLGTRYGHHQPDSAAIKKRHIRHSKEMLDTKRISIKRLGSLEVMRIDGDLSDLVQVKIWVGWHNRSFYSAVFFSSFSLLSFVND